MDVSRDLISKIPKEVSYVTQTLEKSGFEVFLVGGCVRDLIMGREPKDWDVTTNAKPEQIVELFEKTVYENTFGTVAVVVSRETSPQTPLQNTGEGMSSFSSTLEKAGDEVIEVTPYRLEAKYSDFRHPDEVKFSDKLEDDLKRRDFTMNAVAFGPADAKALAGKHKGQSKGQIVDLFGGVKDIENKIIKS